MSCPQSTPTFGRPKPDASAKARNDELAAIDRIPVAGLTRTEPTSGWATKCATGERLNVMLPWPTWHVTAENRVNPSIVCQNCDLHLVLARIEEPPIGWSSSSAAA
jgi:hypothetical protein